MRVKIEAAQLEADASAAIRSANRQRPESSRVDESTSRVDESSQCQVKSSLRTGGDSVVTSCNLKSVMTKKQGKIRCHYEVLGVERDADSSTIKKAHRKLALVHHPDKGGDENEFRLVQEAYECLSDEQDRKWYDQHREAILNGGSGFAGDGGADGGGAGISFIFDLLEFHTASCYDGYGDDEDGFYAVYRMVFTEIMKGEQSGWISEGNIDEAEMPNYHCSEVSFGDSQSDWSEVSEFYSSWEAFSSCLSFAWADQYDPRDAPNRYVRRRIDDENRKARKVAKRERNDDVLALIHFVKRRDPRVRAAKERAEVERKEREVKKAEENERKKKEALEKRKEWREQAERQQAEAEAADVAAGRVRLADLDDSDDDFYGGGRRKGKKGKKGRKKKKKNRWSSDEEEDDDKNKKDADETDNADVEKDDLPPSAQSVEGSEEGEDGADNSQQDAGFVEGEAEVVVGGAVEDEAAAAAEYLDDDELDDESSYVSSSSEEPDFWRCECCRKDFKSEKQLENHLKSKKHKEAMKKYEKKLAKEAKEKALMEEMLDDMELGGE